MSNGASETARERAARYLMGIDVGGTSYDVGLIVDAQPHVSSATYVERHAVALPMLGIHTIGAGGGSIARVDAGGVLRVGPRSAGAIPGPACYGRGGSEPTVTDANLVLGYLNPEATLGGSVKLDVERARAAVEARIAEPLDCSLEVAAFGILRVVNAHMTNGIRVVSVQQGHDPRDFALVAFGGNGAVHAGRQAEDLEIDSVLVPRMAGALSAWGGLQADARVDHLATWIGRCDSADVEVLEERFARLRAQGARVLAGDDVLHEAQLACHYAGQTSEIWVPVGLAGSDMSRQTLAEAAERFHQAHQRERTFAKPDEAVHIFGLKVTTRRPQARALIADGTPARSGAIEPVPNTFRDVYFDEQMAWSSTPIHIGEELEPGAGFDGPAIIEEPDATIAVYPGWRCRLDDSEVYHLRRAYHARQKEGEA
jgi:N-methylhydantoinase A